MNFGGQWNWFNAEKKPRSTHTHTHRHTQERAMPSLTHHREQHVVQQQGDEDDQQDESAGLPPLAEPRQYAHIPHRVQ